MKGRGRSPILLVVIRIACATLCLALSAAGCGDEPLPVAAPEPGGAFAVAWARRQQVLGDVAEAPLVDVLFGARIVRHGGMDRTTVAEVLELSAFETDDVAPGECSDPVTAASLEDVGGVESGAFVELVDVGAIVFHGTDVRGAGAIRLEPRSFPDLLSVVSGVVYAQDAEGSSMAAGAEISFAARGGAGVGFLEATAIVPEEIAGLRVGRQDPLFGAPVLTRGADLEVAWDAGAAGNEVRIELGWLEPAGPVVVSCRAMDDGEFVVPGSRTRLVPELGSTDLSLTVRRVRRSAIAASGLDEGTLVVEQSVTFAVRL